MSLRTNLLFSSAIPDPEQVSGNSALTNKQAFRTEAGKSCIELDALKVYSLMQIRRYKRQPSNKLLQLFWKLK
jgi:hypothetical protein